jgi:hypothetical protein
VTDQVILYTGLGANLGGYIFLAILWSIGWVFLWLQHRGAPTSQEPPLASVSTEMRGENGEEELMLTAVSVTVMSQSSPPEWTQATGAPVALVILWAATPDELGFMVRMPSSATMKLKLLTCAYEGFAYCSFAFFPALPWEKVRVPGQVPEELTPWNVARTAIFEFYGSDAVQLSVFIATIGFVMLSFGALYIVRDDLGPRTLITELCFSALTFPIVKRFIDVFACTGEGKMKTGEYICQTAVGAGPCMDMRPDTLCWSPDHFVYIVVVMLILVPYYIGSLYLRSSLEAETSVVIIDGVYSIVAFQLKMVMAVVASGFGDCRPGVLILTIELAVIIMSLMALGVFKRRFSNVLSLNAVRLAGLLLAATNGLYATYITFKHGSGDTCQATPFQNVSETRLTSINTSNTHPAEPTEKIEYLEFYFLLFLNATVATLSYLVYRRERHRLDARRAIVARNLAPSLIRQVDYSILEYRLYEENKEDFEIWASEGANGEGQQIEDITLKRVLFGKQECKVYREAHLQPPLNQPKHFIEHVHIKGVHVKSQGKATL